MLAAHLFFMKNGTSPAEEPEEEKPILHLGGAQAVYSENIPEQIQYAALGHLHRKQVIDTAPCPVLYSSSPLAYSFSETNQQKYVIMVDAEPGQPVTLTEIPLQQGRRLLRYRSGNIPEALAWLHNNQAALVEITLATEDFLTAEERKQLVSAHPFIINIIPELVDNHQQATSRPDITKNRQELFADYFTHRYGQPPNDAILNLFKELLSAEEIT